MAYDDDPRRHGRTLMREFLGDRSQVELPPPTTEELGRLYQQLPPEAATRLREMGDARQQLELLREWCRAHFRSSPWLPRMSVSKEELLKFYTETLSDDEREKLERMPADQMQFELRRHYFRYKFRDRRPPGGRRGGPPRDGERRGPRGEGRPGPPPPGAGGPADRPTPPPDERRDG